MHGILLGKHALGDELEHFEPCIFGHILVNKSWVYTINKVGYKSDNYYIHEITWWKLEGIKNGLESIEIWGGRWQQG